MSGIQEGKYYWTVQSIDNSFAGSGFADPDTFDFHLDPPVVQAYDLVADSVSWNDMTLSWKRGSGTSCAVFMKEGSSGNPLPSDDSVYYASQDWSDKGSEIQGSGYYCIYNGTDSTVFVSGLDYNTPFHIKVFEFNGWDKRTRYNLSDSINNPLEITTPDVLYPTSPDFSVSDSTGYAPFSISFYNKTSYYTSSFLWDFGDGDSSTLENPHHSYSDPGIYSVKLAAANPVGTKDTVYENLVKVWPALPGVYFSADVRSGDAPLQVTFTNLSDEEAEEYFWDFGDGSTSTGKNPVHTY